MGKLDITCPFCGGLLDSETYKMPKGYPSKIAIFCDNDVCTIKPSSVPMYYSQALNDVDAWGLQNGTT